MPYFIIVKKVKGNSWIYIFIQIYKKMSLVEVIIAQIGEFLMIVFLLYLMSMTAITTSNLVDKHDFFLGIFIFF